jgi:hypothetical protein
MPKLVKDHFDEELARLRSMIRLGKAICKVEAAAREMARLRPRDRGQKNGGRGPGDHALMALWVEAKMPELRQQLVDLWGLPVPDDQVIGHAVVEATSKAAEAIRGHLLCLNRNNGYTTWYSGRDSEIVRMKKECVDNPEVDMFNPDGPYNKLQEELNNG